jgi:hypothetical protein
MTLGESAWTTRANAKTNAQAATTLNRILFFMGISIFLLKSRLGFLQHPAVFSPD